jgi:hypothetical protein
VFRLREHLPLNIDKEKVSLRNASCSLHDEVSPVQSSLQAHAKTRAGNSSECKPIGVGKHHDPRTV